MNVFDYFFEETKDLEKDFVIGNKETISFKELYHNSLKIASFLNENFGTNENIILINQNSVFFITAYLGIIKSGNVCIPLDYSIEQENFNFISYTTESSLIICGKQIKSKLELIKFKSIIDEDSFENILNDNSLSDFLIDYDSENLAEIIFTSGSTGKPKGVMISHQNIISNTDSIIDYLKLTRDDIILVVLPFYYCFGLSLLHTHMKVGGQIVLNNSFMFLSTVINDLNIYNCTGFSGVPSHYQMLLKKSKTFKECSFPELRYVSQAGGKLHDIFIKDFVKYFPEVNFFVMYGQTEATARLSYLAPNMVINKIGSIGKAIPGVTLKIFDKNENETNVGEVGEIVAKGSNIMKGYYKDSEGTGIAIKNGWLYTGDLARLDKDGFIYVEGREKEIIKVGGIRVSPKEIESVIMKIPSVIDCTIKSIEDDILSEAIKAEIVVQSGVNHLSLKHRIKKICKMELATHKIPQLFEFTEVLITKLSGKK